MRSKVIANLCVAGVLAFGAAAFAQSSAQEPAKPQAQAGTRTSAEQQFTVTGCIQREADYRSARDAGKGGAAGTGVGVGNEFILVNASPSARAGEASPTGTAGSAAAYELTGPGESQASQFVGRRVEITGKLKAAETTASGKPTGGATAGQPPSGVDVASKDLKLRELEVASVKEAPGTCPSSK